MAIDISGGGMKHCRLTCNSTAFSLSRRIPEVFGRNLESNIAAVCLAADAVNVIVSNAEVSRFAAGRRGVVYVAVGMRDSKTPAGHIWAIRAGNLMTHTVFIGLNCCRPPRTCSLCRV